MSFSVCRQIENRDSRPVLLRTDIVTNRCCLQKSSKELDIVLPVCHSEAEIVRQAWRIYRWEQFFSGYHLHQIDDFGRFYFGDKPLFLYQNPENIICLTSDDGKNKCTAALAGKTVTLFKLIVTEDALFVEDLEPSLPQKIATFAFNNFNKFADSLTKIRLSKRY